MDYLTCTTSSVKMEEMEIERRRTRARRLVAVKREEEERDRRRKRTRARRLVAMRRIGIDRSKMKHGDRYPRVNFRIEDDLLGRIAKEIDKSGMSISEIAKKALSEYLDKREK